MLVKRGGIYKNIDSSEYGNFLALGFEKVINTDEAIVKEIEPEIVVKEVETFEQQEQTEQEQVGAMVEDEPQEQPAELEEIIEVEPEPIPELEPETKVEMPKGKKGKNKKNI